MLPKTLMKGFDERRLRWLLAALFLALGVPTGALIWQAYSQLKWEAFHQYRGLAEELTVRVDKELAESIAAADARSFADYTFLNVSGETRFNFVERSPLSAYPVSDDIPGALGYFQVGPDGSFSTPLLPPAGENAEIFGIGAAEYENRLRLAQQIQTVLAENRLLRYRADAGSRRELFSPAEDSRDAAEEGAKEQDGLTADTRFANARPQSEAERANAPRIASDTADKAAVGGYLDESADDDYVPDDAAESPEVAAANEVPTYSQQRFDELKQRRVPVPASSASVPTRQAGEPPAEERAENERPETIGKVADLNLDAELQKKSENVERAREADRLEVSRSAAPSRAKRREQIALPETAPAADRQSLVNVAGPTGLRINTFESEVDPLDFSLLDSGHIVFFRNVWRDGERFIQGLLVDPDAFISGAIEQAFYESPLSAMSNLIVGYRDDVIRFFPGPADSSYPGSTGELRGALLYSSRLSAPLDSLELIFSINSLPQGPGANVLAWVTLVLAGVFVGGFVTLYRLGLGQIRLARQQQDFVSAVSHELKTPLTSIRMYGEMLKEGWADESKRQDYYEFIHDESERLTRMITNVLQLAKITRNEPSFDMKRRNVGELLGNIESRISNQLERAGFTLKVDRDARADASTIEIDDDCLTQIIINLVDNAIKFSRDAQSKTIEIGSRLVGDKRVQFSVRDYGPGIPRDQMKKIFRLFYRSESELTRETVGTGIGLAIVHQLTTAMNGKVDVVNAEPGAEFRISFPI